MPFSLRPRTGSHQLRGRCPTSTSRRMSAIDRDCSGFTTAQDTSALCIAMRAQRPESRPFFSSSLRVSETISLTFHGIGIKVMDSTSPSP